MRITLAAAVLGTVFAALPADPVAAQAGFLGANTAAVQDDFNGDGYRDLAVGAPEAANGTVESAGAVVVLYGSASGVSAERRSVLTQATSGIPGSAEEGDGFGAAVASADLDRDGYADLLVGTPWEDVGATESRGAVTVVWGGAAGLGSGASITPPTGFGRDGRTYCRYGMTLAVGDMSGDGTAEVTVGSRCEGSTFIGPFTRAGEAGRTVLEEWLGMHRGVVVGDVTGDGVAERFWLPGPSSDDLRGSVHLDAPDPETGAMPELPEADGYTGQIGDVNGDGYGDLVTGIRDDDYLAGQPGAAHPGGEIQVLYGSAEGITSTQKPQVFHQETAGVPGAGEMGDQFGDALSIGDVDADGYADVLVGAPGEAIGTNSEAGMAVLLHGSSTGLITAKATSYTQDTADIPGVAEAGDRFGDTVHVTDLNMDGKLDSVVGTPGENSDGCVWNARGTTSGPTVPGSSNLCGSTAGITVGAAGARFGAALAGPHTEL